jgi:predicted nicotinamide N-methyase
MSATAAPRAPRSTTRQSTTRPGTTRPGRSRAELRAFVRRHTRLQQIPELPGVRVHVGDDIMELCRLVGIELRDPDPPLPYWAFPWAGGLGLVCHLRDHPDEVEGRTVLDFATGSGLCAIAALRAGAADVVAVDIDPLAVAAADLNLRANHATATVRRQDLLDDLPPAVDVILAGDVCYEETMAQRISAWLEVAARSGTRVLLGDIGRTYLPRHLVRVAAYDVMTSGQLENSTTKSAGVFTFPDRR